MAAFFLRPATPSKLSNTLEPLILVDLVVVLFRLGRRHLRQQRRRVDASIRFKRFNLGAVIRLFGRVSLQVTQPINKI